MKKRLAALLLTVMMGVTALTGCGGKSSDWEDGDGKIDGDLTFWTQDTEAWKKYFDPAIEAFKKEYPDVKVNVEYFADFAEKASQAFSAGEEPDVIQTWQSITDWAKAGKIVAVPEDVVSKADLEANYYESALKNKIYDGKYYGIPSEISVESPSLYVNMDILEKEGIELPAGWIENNGPKDFNELITLANQLTLKDEEGLVTRSGLAYNYAQWEANFLSLIMQYGGDYKDEANNKVKFLTDEGRKAAETLLKYCDGEAAVSEMGDTRYDLFIQGTAAMCVGAPWYAGSFTIDIADVNWQVFNMPAWVDGADPISIGAGGWGYAVTEKCENKEAAWAFTKFMTSAKQTGDWAYTTGALPARTDSLTELEYDPNVGSVDKAIAIAKDILPFARDEGAYMVTPSTLTYTIVREKLRQMVVDKDIEAALNGMETEGNAMIEENLSR
jgi:arabinogalactan oligomer/maltooligosaccharide transport system substrate-binding protein